MPDHVKQQVTGKEVPRMIAIINSMTKKERRNPALLNGSRRARIARGSGLTPADVNKLMKQYQQMEKMMGKLGRGGMKGMMRGHERDDGRAAAACRQCAEPSGVMRRQEVILPVGDDATPTIRRSLLHAIDNLLDERRSPGSPVGISSYAPAVVTMAMSSSGMM